jgi:hypothetical protein
MRGLSGSGDNPRAAGLTGDDATIPPLELEEDRACFRVQNSGCLVKDVMTGERCRG